MSNSAARESQHSAPSNFTSPHHFIVVFFFVTFVGWRNGQTFTNSFNYGDLEFQRRAAKMDETLNSHKILSFCGRAHGYLIMTWNDLLPFCSSAWAVIIIMIQKCISNDILIYTFIRLFRFLHNCFAQTSLTENRQKIKIKLKMISWRFLNDIFKINAKHLSVSVPFIEWYKL